jgi:hypothetical protein
LGKWKKEVEELNKKRHSRDHPITLTDLPAMEDDSDTKDK